MILRHTRNAKTEYTKSTNTNSQHYFEQPKLLKQVDCLITRVVLAGRTSRHTVYWHPAATLKLIINRKTEKSILRNARSSRSRFKHFLSFFPNFTKPRSDFRYRSGRCAPDEPSWTSKKQTQIANFQKFTYRGSNSEHAKKKRLASSLQPERVPWAKMATVLKVPQRQSASLLQRHKALKKTS